jgi:hypothetical protein
VTTAEPRHASSPDERSTAQHAVFGAIVGGLAGWVVAGTIGFVAGVVCGALVVIGPRILPVAAVVGSAVLGGLTVLEEELDEELIRTFSATRPRTHDAGLVLVVVWAAAAIVVWRSVEPESTVGSPDRADRRRWLLLMLLVLAVVATAVAID